MSCWRIPWIVDDVGFWYRSMVVVLLLLTKALCHYCKVSKDFNNGWCPTNAPGPQRFRGMFWWWILNLLVRVLLVGGVWYFTYLEFSSRTVLFDPKCGEASSFRADITCSNLEWCEWLLRLCCDDLVFLIFLFFFSYIRFICRLAYMPFWTYVFCRKTNYLF